TRSRSRVPARTNESTSGHGHKSVATQTTPGRSIANLSDPSGSSTVAMRILLSLAGLGLPLAECRDNDVSEGRKSVFRQAISFESSYIEILDAKLLEFHNTLEHIISIANYSEGVAIVF